MSNVPLYHTRTQMARMQEVAPQAGVTPNYLGGVAEMGDEFIHEHQRQAKERQSREDTIARARDNRAFFEAASNEFTRLQAEEDLSDSSVLERYNAFLMQQRDSVLAKHRGSADSKAALEAKFENDMMTFGARASQRVQEAQKTMVANSFMDGAEGYFAEVMQGGMSMDEALAAVDMLADEHSGAIPSDEMIAMTEAAQAMVISGAMDNLSIQGDWNGLETMIRDHPEVVQSLGADKVQSYIRTVQTGRREMARGANETLERKRGVLAAMGVDHPSQLAPDMRYYYETGQELPAAAKEDISPARRIARDAEQMRQKFGENSLIYRQFLQAADLVKAGPGGPGGGARFTPHSRVGKLMLELEQYQAAGIAANDPRVQGVLNAIREEDPEHQKRVELVEAMPKAQMALEGVVGQAQMMERQIDQALMLATGVNTVMPGSPGYDRAVQEAMTKAVRGDFSTLATGGGGAVASLLPFDNNANNLQATLSTIGANTVLSTMQELRAASPTGSTGMGVMSDRDTALFMESEGSLSQETPKTMVQTLLRMKAEVPAMAQRQVEAFQGEFGAVLPPRPAAPAAQSAPQGGDQLARISLTGQGIDAAAPQAPQPREQALVEAYRNGEIDRETAAQQIAAMRGIAQ